jgi:hypothetical protein
VSDQPKCCNCGSTKNDFKRIQELTRHLTGEKDYVCSNCLPADFFEPPAKSIKLPDDMQKIVDGWKDESKDPRP